ncbi:MAG: hypothetical protein LLG00_12640 [Planctomycetaceae bacterium]|nr:hypothetical protein [Planctomycetaceae bacterium]
MAIDITYGGSPAALAMAGYLGGQNKYRQELENAYLPMFREKTALEQQRFLEGERLRQSYLLSQEHNRAMADLEAYRGNLQLQHWDRQQTGASQRSRARIEAENERARLGRESQERIAGIRGKGAGSPKAVAGDVFGQGGGQLALPSASGVGNVAIAGNPPSASDPGYGSPDTVAIAGQDVPLGARPGYTVPPPYWDGEQLPLGAVNSPESGDGSLGQPHRGVSRDQVPLGHWYFADKHNVKQRGQEQAREAPEDQQPSAAYRSPQSVSILGDETPLSAAPVYRASAPLAATGLVGNATTPPARRTAGVQLPGYIADYERVAEQRRRQNAGVAYDPQTNAYLQPVF